jgi:hypothetical protein
MQKGVFRKNLCLQWSNRALPGDDGDGLPSSPIFFSLRIPLWQLVCLCSRSLFTVVVRPHCCGAIHGAFSLTYQPVYERKRSGCRKRQVADVCLNEKIRFRQGGSGTHYLSMKHVVKDFIHAGISLWWRILFPGFEKVWHGDCFTQWHGGRTQNPVSSLSRQTQESTRC